MLADNRMICPCCKQPMAAQDRPDFLEYVDRLRPMDRKIVCALIAAYPVSISMPQLVDRVYADDIDGGPEWASSSVAARLVYVRREVIRHGWRIPSQLSGPGAQARYKLERDI